MDNPFEELDKKFKTSPTAALDKSLVEHRKEKKLPTTQTTEEQQLEQDFQEARDMLKRAGAYNEEAIQGILHIAKNSDHPRAYEVAGQLIKTMQENAKDMMDIQGQKKKVQKDDNKSQQKGVTNNNLFVGSTKDLLRALGKEEPKVIEGN